MTEEIVAHTDNKISEPLMYDFNGHQVRAFIDDQGDPWFVAKDISDILGYREAEKMTRLLSAEDRSTRKAGVSSYSNGLTRRMTVISEGALYAVILKRESAYIKDDAARRSVAEFQHWVTHDVLPSIRRHGIYATDITIEKMISDPDFAIQLLTQLKEYRERQRKLEEENQRLSDRYETLRDDVREKVIPYAEIGRAVTKNIYAMSVLQLSHVLQSCGAKDLGRNRLFQRMRDDGLIHIENGENLPYQFARENGWMTTKLVECSDGRWRNQIYITPKGLRHLVQRYAHKTLSNDEVSMYMEKYGEVERQEIRTEKAGE